MSKIYTFSIAGKSYEVALDQVTDTSVSAVVNGKKIDVEIAEIRTIQEEIVERPRPAPRPEAAQNPATKKVTSAASKIIAPIPGQIIEIYVRVGDTLSIGSKVLMMEAMKLENEITATKSGVIKAIHVHPGDSVGQDQLLVELE